MAPDQQITLTDPADVGKYYVGQSVTFKGRDRWWRRLLYWLRILKRPTPTTMTVLGVDYRTGAVAIGTRGSAPMLEAQGYGFCTTHWVDCGEPVNAVTMRLGIALCASCARVYDRKARP